MRDKVIHFYHGVDYEVVWKVANDDLPPLKCRLQEIYKILEEQRNHFQLSLYRIKTSLKVKQHISACLKNVANYHTFKYIPIQNQY